MVREAGSAKQFHQTISDNLVVKLIIPKTRTEASRRRNLCTPKTSEGKLTPARKIIQNALDLGHATPKLKGLHKAKLVHFYSEGPSKAVLCISCHIRLLRSPLSSSESFRVFFSLSEQLMWEFEQYEDEDLQDHALAATTQNNAVCSKNVSIFHVDFLLTTRRRRRR